jgi:hypothetical protein
LSWVFETRTTFVAGFDPKATVAPGAKPVPFTMTTVPAGPLVGLIEATVGMSS